MSEGQKGFRFVEISIAFFAMLISILALSFTYYNQQEQDRRWNKLNLGQIDVSNIKFYTFKVVKTDELKKIGINTSYQYYSGEDGITDKAIVPFMLVLWDKTNNKRLNLDFFDSVSKAEEYINLHKLNHETTDIYRFYILSADIKNIGNSKVENVTVDVKSNLDTEAIPDPANKTKDQIKGLRYVPQKTFFIKYNFYLPRNKELPDNITWNVTTKYKDESGMEKNDTFYFKYDGFSWHPISPSDENTETPSK